MHIPQEGDSVGLRARAYGCRARTLLPTKTSRLEIQSVGRSIWLLRTCSHVFFAVWMDLVSRLIRVAVILSSVSLILIARVHLFFISFVVWAMFWITRSHRRTQIRWADSDSRMCSSRVAPFGAVAWFRSLGRVARATISGMRMLPQPRMIPREMSGQNWGGVGP